MKPIGQVWKIICIAILLFGISIAGFVYFGYIRGDGEQHTVKVIINSDAPSDNVFISISMYFNGVEQSPIDYIQETSGDWQFLSYGLTSGTPNASFLLSVPESSESWLKLESEGWTGKVLIEDIKKTESVSFEKSPWGVESIPIRTIHYVRKNWLYTSSLAGLISVLLGVYCLASIYGWDIGNELVLITICIIARYSYGINGLSYSIFDDSGAYMEYYFNSVRQPLYPFFISVCRYLLGKHYLYLVVFGQSVVGLLSAILLYRALKEYFHKKFALLIACCYGCLPVLVFYEFCILTESLSVTVLTIWISLLLFYINRAKKSLALAINIVTILLTMIRPTNIILGLILLFFWGIKAFDRKNTTNLCDVFGLISWCTFPIIVIIYSYVCFRLTGYFGLSSAGEENQLLTLIMQNMYITDKSNVGIFQSQISRELSSGKNAWAILSETREWLRIATQENNGIYGEFKEYLNSCVKSNLIGYFDYNIRYFASEMKSGWDVVYMKGNYSFLELLCHITWPIDIGMCVYVMTICFLYDMYIWISKHIIKWITLGLSSIGIGFIIIGVLGAPIEASRHSLSAIPVMLVLLAFVFNSLTNIGNNMNSGREEDDSTLYV